MNYGQMTYTLQEASALLKVCAKTLRRIIESGKLKAFRVGRQWRIRASAIEEFQKRLEDDYVAGGLAK